VPPRPVPTAAAPSPARPPEPRRESVRDPAPPRRDDPALASRDGGGRGGWLSDLLIRASREDDDLPRTGSNLQLGIMAAAVFLLGAGAVVIAAARARSREENELLL